MSDEVIDWTKAAMTEIASQHAEDARLRVIVVPRAAFGVWAKQPWAELERAAFLGVDGLAPLVVANVDKPDADLAFMREATGRDRSLVGRAIVYIQGW